MTKKNKACTGQGRVAKRYSIERHSHVFAAWAAGRASCLGLRLPVQGDTRQRNS
jgi:hypothetical protein